jgi:hypothetical protein
MALLVVEQGVVNPQELLPCVRCGLATCGWCEACGPLWASMMPAGAKRKARPICYTCDCEQRVCPECDEEGFSWAGARREYRDIYPEIHRFKVGGTWQAHVAEMEKTWLRRQFVSSSWWCPQARAQAALPAPVGGEQDVAAGPEDAALDEPDLVSTHSEADTTPFPAEGAQYRHFGINSADGRSHTPPAAFPSSEASCQGSTPWDLDDNESLRSPIGRASSVASTAHTAPARPAAGQPNEVWL